jgi:hypothetical protein
MRGGAADRVEPFVADYQVDVGAIGAERVVAGQIEGSTGLPPAVLRRDDPVG